VPLAAVAALAAGGASLTAWLALLARPDRPWDLQPVAEDEPPPPDPPTWPSVTVVVPARDEVALLPQTLPSLLGQDYPGPWRALVVDDRSRDNTAAIARALGAEALDGAELPAGWVGKVWALEQGVRAAGEAPAYILFTDADIRHAPGSLRRLVAEAEAGGLALVSRMAQLRCERRPERLLIPPFVLFFNLLYPMRRVNDPVSRVAACAGGCVLVRRKAFEAAGGTAAIRGEIIDDVRLAGRVKAPGRPIRLARSRADVVSLREYPTVGAVWRMVRRTAFDQLGYSWLLLVATVVSLAAHFLVPPALTVAGAALAVSGHGAAWIAAAALGAAAWAVTAVVFRPATRAFGLGWAWSCALPAAGVVYGAIPIDSARRHLLRKRGEW
jgi:hopene-associated glycosyltransferase HpnB